MYRVLEKNEDSSRVLRRGGGQKLLRDNHLPPHRICSPLSLSRFHFLKISKNILIYINMFLSAWLALPRLSSIFSAIVHANRSLLAMVIFVEWSCSKTIWPILSFFIYDLLFFIFHLSFFIVHPFFFCRSLSSVRRSDKKSRAGGCGRRDDPRGTVDFFVREGNGGFILVWGGEVCRGEGEACCTGLISVERTERVAQSSCVYTGLFSIIALL